MKHLFDSSDGWTDEARALDCEANKLLTPLVQKYASLGYSKRDIQSVLSSTLMSIIVREITLSKPNRQAT